MHRKICTFLKIFQKMCFTFPVFRYTHRDTYEKYGVYLMVTPAAFS